jgi:hypothetical protein
MENLEMLTLEQIKERMIPMNLRVVSSATGISYNRLWMTLNGRKRNVNYDDVVKLSDYLEAQNAR